MKEDEEEMEGITLKVMESKIGSVDSGIARIHSGYLEDIELGDDHLVSIKSEDNEISVKLVADKLADKKVVILRSGDMEKLEVESGSEVLMEPYITVKEEMKDLWERIKDKFTSDDEEEEE